MVCQIRQQGNGDERNDNKRYLAQNSCGYFSVKSHRLRYKTKDGHEQEN